MSLKSTYKTLLFFYLFLNIGFSYSQTADSLKLLLKNVKHDTTRCNILNLMIEAENDDAVWSGYNAELKTTAENNLKKNNLTKQEKQLFTKYLASSLNNLGVLYNLKNDTKNALKYYKESLANYIKCGEKQGIASSYNNLAYIYQHNGDIPNAIAYYSKSLKIWEELKHLEGSAYVLNNLGFLNKELGNIEAALTYYKKCLAIREQLGNQKTIATTIHNIGSIYILLPQFDSTLIYLYKGLKIREKISDKRGIGDSWHMIGAVYDHKQFKNHNSDSALKYYELGLKYRKEIDDRKGLAYSYGNIGNIYFKQKNYKKAEIYYSQSLKLSKELGFPDNIWEASKFLAELYKITGNYKSAFENYQLYITMRDSLNNIETAKAAIKQQTEYDYLQKKAIADAENKAKLKLQEETARAEKNKQNIIIAAVSVVLLLVVVFSVFLYNRFKVTQKQKTIIELKEKETHAQKEIIEEKHKEITDSINYAERIQRSFLATKDLLDANLNPDNYFILFKPKDVVSGDFYWAHTLLNGNFAFATADSTGHGVPGAIMSLLNITSLEKAIEQTSDPAGILSLTRQTIINRLKKDGSAEGGKDGMDCSLIVFDFKRMQLQIAAAHNPVWIVRSSIPEPVEGNDTAASVKTVTSTSYAGIIEIKPDKMPVGKHDRDTEAFTLHTINLQSGDIIYALTDGFPDQFGGPKGKKFMSKNLKELLVANSHLPLSEQYTLLKKTFANWVGTNEQVDDVTLVAIKV